MKIAKKNVLIVKGELHNRPVGVAQNSINFLSTLSKDQTSRRGIQNKVAVISGARKVVGKHRMLDTVHVKIDIIDHKVKEVIELFKPLVSRGIHFFWEEKGPSLTQEEYLERLVLRRSNHNKFGNMQHALLGSIVFDKLARSFELSAYFKATCATVSDFSYRENT